MIFKCKICGGQVQVDRATGVCVCEYCGTKQAIPLFTDDSSKRLYESGNNYLQHCEYDKAENVFNQLLSISPQESEIYWDLVMCKYGVTFVRDPRTGKYIPTCNRTHYDSVLNDKNYINALKFSTEEKNAFYRSSGETIDKIQKGIIAVVKKEKPFDIFISYKETDQKGNRTKDSVVAQELYEKLVQAGYKVFFSRITLEDKIGSEYEPYIYAALSSSKVMLTVSSSKENIEAPWVKNEWSRFLTLRQKNADKTLIPLYFDMPKSDLPAEFTILSPQDMSMDGFEQELIRGIKKLIPLPIMIAEKRKKIRKKLKIAGLVFCLLALIGVIAAIPWLIKIPDYNDAMQLYYDQKYPEATWAFADLGTYRNSAEMKKTCEQSWRNSLAITITDLVDGARIDSTCYIDENGNVCTLEENAVSSNLTVNEHGKVASLAFYNKRNAIYDDGYVSNISNSFSGKDEWHNIVQLSPNFDYTTVALRADGTMLYGILVDDDEYQNHNLPSNEWMRPIKNWRDIVSFTSGVISPIGYGTDGWGYSYAYIMGLRADGTVELVESTGTTCSLSKSEAREIVNKRGLSSSTSTDALNPPQKFVLDNTGTLWRSSVNMPVLKDIIININNHYAISKNGNVYKLSPYSSDQDPVLIDNIKVRTYKEWKVSEINKE